MTERCKERGSFCKSFCFHFMDFTSLFLSAWRKKEREEL